MTRNCCSKTRPRGQSTIFGPIVMPMPVPSDAREQVDHGEINGAVNETYMYEHQSR